RVNVASHEVAFVVADHRSVTVHYQGEKVCAVLDIAHLRRVTLVLQQDDLIWQLDAPDFTVLLVPFGVPGESGLRRELQDLPGFDTHLLFSYLDHRTEQVPPLVLWQA
ncbi:MAG: hypothetical protein WED11_06645, partial [Natronospirillum sp.]